MNYNEALSYIHSIPKFIRPLGNAQLTQLLQCLGNPQNKLKFIHIVGTNGKGSTCAMLAEILKCAGYKVGLFTSPFIELFNERIKINGENISDSEIAEYISTVKSVMLKNNISVSEFAFITAVAFLYFYDKDCELVVLEAGMGGRLDATNVISDSLLSVITSISLDHTQYLGDTEEEIAIEKCGVIKDGGTVVAYPNKSVMHIIKSEADKHNASLIEVQNAVATKNGFKYKNIEYLLSLKGSYQPQNAATALEAVFALRGMKISIPDSAINEGLQSTKWAARFEFINDRLIIDGGHNPDGIKALKKSLMSLDRPIIIVAAMMEDKACSECIYEISSVADRFIATELSMPRCERAEKLLSYSQKGGEAIGDCVKAVSHALELADGNAVVCVCGSLYLAGEIRKKFK